MFLFCI